jgi:hypothetical protein
MKNYFNTNIKGVLENKIISDGRRTENSDSRNYPFIASNQGIIISQLQSNTSFDSSAGFDLDDTLASVFWRAGKITYKNTCCQKIAISFNFAGCYMAKFAYEDSFYIAHIHCGAPPDCRDSWNNFVPSNSSINVLSLFQPTNNRDFISEAKNGKFADKRTSICGIIKPDNTCHAVLVDISNSEPLFTTLCENIVTGMIPR